MKKLNPIETPADDLTTIVRKRDRSPSEGAQMVDSDLSDLPLVFGVSIHDEPCTLADEWGK